MKSPHTIIAVLVALSLGAAGDALAQHQGHEGASMAAQAKNEGCAQGGLKALAIVESANAQIETARRATTPVALEDTMAELHLAVAAAQAELFACRAAVPALPVGSTPAAMTGMDHSKMTMAGMDHSKMNTGAPVAGATPAPSAAKPAAAMAGMDHSTMNMGKSPAGVKPAAPRTKAVAAMAGMDHSTMDMGKPAAGVKPAAPRKKDVAAMAGTDHSTMDMGKPAAGAKPVARRAKPATTMPGMDHSKMDMDKSASAAKPAASDAKPAGAMAGMNHSNMAMGGATAKPAEVPTAVRSEARLPAMMAGRIADPDCAGNVGQASAPKAVFERKVYYFCSTTARDEFRKDPAAYLKQHPR